MRGMSPVVAGILVVGVTIAVALSGYYWIQSMEVSTASSGSAAVATIATLPPEVGIAKVTTPYTWEVWVRNPNSAPISMEGVTSYLMDADGQTCAFSDGFVADSNVVPANSVKKFVFYGWNKCKIPKNRENWFVRVVFGPGRESRVVTPVSSEDMGLVLWMPFESVWDFDWSGNDLDVHYYDEEFQGTLQGVHNGDIADANTTNADGDTPPQWTDGRRGSALQFDGTDDYVEVTGTPVDTSNPDANTTVCLWFYWDPDVAKTNTWKYSWMLFAWSSGYDIWYCCGEIGINTGRGEKLGTVWSEPKKWTHICVVFPNKYPDNNQNARIWIDGQSVELHLYGSSPNNKTVTTTAYIGASEHPGSYMFPGIIDDVRIYNRALTDEEVKELYEGKDVREGLVLYLPFDEGTGTTAYDWHNWSKNGAWFSGGYNGNVVDYISGIYGLPSTITTPYTMVARAKVFKPNNALVTRTTAHSTLYIGTENYSPCIHVDYNYNDGTPALDLCLHDINAYGKECTIVGGYTPPNGTVRICASCGSGIECNEASYSYGTPDPAQNNTGMTIGAIWAKDSNKTKGYIYEVRYYGRMLSEQEMRCIAADKDCLTDDTNLVVMYTFREPCRSGPTDLSTNRLCRAPKILEVNGMRGVKLNGSRAWFWIPDSDKMRGNPDVQSIVGVAAFENLDYANGHGLLQTIVSKGDEHHGWWIGFDNRSNKSSSWIEIGAGDSSWYQEVFHIGPIQNGVPTILAAAYHDINATNGGLTGYANGIKQSRADVPSTAIAFSDDPEYIGRYSSIAYHIEGKVFAVMRISKVLDEDTLNALCKLFKAC